MVLSKVPVRVKGLEFMTSAVIVKDGCRIAEFDSVMLYYVIGQPLTAFVKYGNSKATIGVPAV